MAAAQFPPSNVTSASTAPSLPSVTARRHVTGADGRRARARRKEARFTPRSPTGPLAGDAERKKTSQAKPSQPGEHRHLHAKLE